MKSLSLTSVSKATEIRHFPLVLSPTGGGEATCLQIAFSPIIIIFFFATLLCDLCCHTHGGPHTHGRPHGGPRPHERLPIVHGSIASTPLYRGHLLLFGK